MATAERTEFLKSLASYKAQATKLAKVATSSGYLEDSEIIETLGLTEGERMILVARLSRFAYGKDKNKQPYFQVKFTVAEGSAKGTPLSDFIGFPKSDKARCERSWETLFRYFQKMGIDTTEWSGDVLAAVADAADGLTAARPFVRLTLSIYQKRNSKGVAEGDARLNIGIIGTADESDGQEQEDPPEAEEEETEEEETEEVEEEEEAEEEDYETVEPPEAEEEEEEDLAAWVGYAGTIEVESGTIEGSATAFDEDAKTFTFTVEGYDDANIDGDYEVVFSDITWAE